MYHAVESTHKFNCALQGVESQKLIALLFADDGCIAARSAHPEQLQNLLDLINSGGKLFGLRMNPMRCRVLMDRSSCTWAENPYHR